MPPLLSVIFSVKVNSCEDETNQTEQETGNTPPPSTADLVLNCHEFTIQLVTARLLRHRIKN